MTPEELATLGRITEYLKALAAAHRAFARTTRARTDALKPKVKAAVWESRYPRYRRTQGMSRDTS